MAVNTEVKTVASLGFLYAIRMLGLFMVLPVMTVYGANYSGASAASLGLALGIYGLSQSLLQIPLGLCSDFIGRKPVIVGGLLIFALGSVVAALADSVTGLIIGRALQGAGAIASTTMALVADLTSEQNRSKAMAAIGASIGFSFMLAMVLGPAISGAWGLSGIFVVTALLALLGCLIVLFVVPTPKRIDASARRESGAVPALLWSTLRRLDLARLNFGIFVLHASLTALFVVVPGMLLARMQLPASAHWKIYLPLLLIAFLMAVPLMMMAERRQRSKEAFVLAVAALALALLFTALSPASAVYLLSGLFVFFIGFNLLEAQLPSMVSKTAPAGGKGTAMGIYSSAQFIGAFVGGSLGGWIAERWGLDALLLSLVVLTAAWFCVALSMPRLRNLSSLCLPARDSVAQLDLCAREGIEDAIYVREDQLLYLKVDRKRLDLDALHELLEAHRVDANSAQV